MNNFFVPYNTNNLVCHNASNINLSGNIYTKFFLGSSNVAIVNGQTYSTGANNTIFIDNITVTSFSASTPTTAFVWGFPVGYPSMQTGYTFDNNVSGPSSGNMFAPTLLGMGNNN